MSNHILTSTSLLADIFIFIV